MQHHVIDRPGGAQRFQLCQQRVLLNQIGPAAQYPSAFARRTTGPAAAFQRLMRHSHGTIDILRRGVLQRGIDPAIGGTFNLKGCALALTVLAANIMASWKRNFSGSKLNMEEFLICYTHQLLVY